VEDILKSYLGVRKVIWLGAGFFDAETDGHVDNIACFVGPGRVIVGIPTTRTHPDYTAVQDAMSRLRVARDAEGRKLEIISLPQPKKQRQIDALDILQGGGGIHCITQQEPMV
jgi:agmatine deiminase